MHIGARRWALLCVAAQAALAAWYVGRPTGTLNAAVFLTAVGAAAIFAWISPLREPRIVLLSLVTGGDALLGTSGTVLAFALLPIALFAFLGVRADWRGGRRDVELSASGAIAGVLLLAAAWLLPSMPWR